MRRIVLGYLGLDLSSIPAWGPKQRISLADWQCFSGHPYDISRSCYAAEVCVPDANLDPEQDGLDCD